MNKIILNGIIKDIEYSHNIKDVEFYKANIITQRPDGKEDFTIIKFKKFSNPYQEGDFVSLVGHVRTFSRKIGNKSSVEIYVFTYFDQPEQSGETQETNRVQLLGNICKKNAIRKTRQGKDVLDIILVNSIETDTSKLNCYLPLCFWGKQAKEVNEFQVGTKLYVEGRLISREYKKFLNETEFEIRVAHEINVDYLEV